MIGNGVTKLEEEIKLASDFTQSVVPGIRPLLLNLGWIFLSAAYFFIVCITHSSSKGEQTVKVEFLCKGLLLAGQRGEVHPAALETFPNQKKKAT